MKKFDQINMIPFIDIMLVLLAIVLTTASFVSKGLIQVDLPDADQAQVIEEMKESVQIALTEADEIYLNETSVTILSLNERLMDLDKSTEIQLRIDRSARFEGFIEIVNVLKALNLENFSIETQFSQS